MERINPQYPEITAGEPLAEKIKEFNYPNKSWNGIVAWDVGIKMASFKNFTRKFYSHLNEVQFLHEVSRYTQRDIGEVIEEIEKGDKNWKPNSMMHIGNLIVNYTEKE